MRRIWMVVAALACVILASEARADTVYLTNGQSLWGREVYEEGDAVVIVRPSGDIRIPKSQVKRIEGVHTTLPPFYSAPEQTAPSGELPGRGVGPGGAPGTLATPGAPPPAGGPVPPGAPRGELSPAPTPGGSALAPPYGGTATQLPPPPPPPAPGR